MFEVIGKSGAVVGQCGQQLGNRVKVGGCSGRLGDGQAGGLKFVKDRAQVGKLVDHHLGKQVWQIGNDAGCDKRVLHGQPSGQVCQILSLALHYDPGIDQQQLAAKTSKQFQQGFDGLPPLGDHLGRWSLRAQCLCDGRLWRRPDDNAALTRRQKLRQCRKIKGLHGNTTSRSQSLCRVRLYAMRHDDACGLGRFCVGCHGCAFYPADSISINPSSAIRIRRSACVAGRGGH